MARERLLEVIDSGRRTATYKLALLLALLDLCARRRGLDGRPPDVLYTREIAERVAAIYWPQTMPYPQGTEAIQLRRSPCRGRRSSARCWSSGGRPRPPGWPR